MFLKPRIVWLSPIGNTPTKVLADLTLTSNWTATLPLSKPLPMATLDNYTNEQLLNAVRMGDCPAFNEVYYRYRRKVSGYAYHFTGSREEAEELTQDIFVKLWETRARIDPLKNFDAYLYTLIRNNFLEALRKKARANIFRKENITEEPYCKPIDDLVDFKECRQIASQAIETLSPQVKATYILSRDNGYSHAEISRRMGISKHTVNNHIKKSLKTIRKCFKKYSPETILSLSLLFFC
jgi:RNA polymerase sigma-70 factor (family 1)